MGSSVLLRVCRLSCLSDFLVVACGALFRDRASNVGPMHWESRDLAPGLQAKCLTFLSYSSYVSILSSLQTLCSLRKMNHFITVSLLEGITSTEHLLNTF